MKKLVLWLIVIVVGAGAWWQYRRFQVSQLQQKAAKVLSENADSDEARKLLAEAAAKGTDEDKRRCAQLTLLSVVKEHDGAWTVTGDHLKPAAAPLGGVRLTVTKTVWGDRSGIGENESRAWIVFTLINHGSKPLTVSAERFAAVHNGIFWCNRENPAESDGKPFVLAPGKGVGGALLFPIMGQCPGFLDFFSDGVLARARIERHESINDKDRTAYDVPGGKSLADFPVDKRFSEQMLPDAVVAAAKSASAAK